MCENVALLWIWKHLSGCNVISWGCPCSAWHGQSGSDTLGSYVLAAQARLWLRPNDMNSPDLAAAHIKFLSSVVLSGLIRPNWTPPQPLRHLVHHSGWSAHKLTDTAVFVLSCLTESYKLIHFCQGNLSVGTRSYSSRTFGWEVKRWFVPARVIGTKLR